MPDQPRPRAVFSTVDFALLRESVKEYMVQLMNNEYKDIDQNKVATLGRLYHRLGRVDGE